MNELHTQPMLREGSLKDKVIVVTGGGTGLGKSMSRYFLELGARVAIASRKAQVLEKAASELSQTTGGEALPVPCDVRDYVQVEQMLQAVLKRFGKADALVNNAAGNFVSPTERLSHHAFDAVVDIVLKGSYNCTLAFGKHWIKEKQQGNVLSIITTYAWTGSGYVVPSACGKAGVLALTRSLAVEWAKYGIRLNAIAPGLFPTTGAWDRLMPGPFRQQFDLAKKVPLGRTGHHQELANLAAYLLSDYSAFITGDAVTIDGGEWLRGAGQFNMLEKVPYEMWDGIEKMVRSAGSKSQ